MNIHSPSHRTFNLSKGEWLFIQMSFNLSKRDWIFFQMSFNLPEGERIFIQCRSTYLKENGYSFKGTK